MPGGIIEIKERTKEILANLMQMSLTSLQERLELRFSSAGSFVNDELAIVMSEDK